MPATNHDHDPEFDQMRILGRVCGEVAKAIRDRRIPEASCGCVIDEALAEALEPEERPYLPAAVVIVKEMLEAGAIPRAGYQVGHA